jgi:hypothetical protein
MTKGLEKRRVAQDSERLGAALSRVLDSLPDDGRVLAVAGDEGYSVESLQ